MDETATKPWCCKRCGKQLATVEHDADGKLRLVFDTASVRQVTRAKDGVLHIECFVCGEVRRWFGALDSAEDA